MATDRRCTAFRMHFPHREFAIATRFLLALKAPVEAFILGANDKEGKVPQIIVTADHGQEQDGIMLRERVNAADFESERFAANLIERLGWAVVDATEVETPDRQPEPAQVA